MYKPTGGVESTNQLLLALLEIVLIISGYQKIAKTEVICFILSVLLSNLQQNAQVIVGVSPTFSNATQLKSCFQDN